MAYSDIISKTAEVYVACEIHSFPVNCVDIIESYGYKVYTYSYIKALYPRLYDYCRSYSTDSFKHAGLGCVMYNDACRPGRILFSLAHEIGHIALGHVGEASEFEAAADTFAGYLLAPCVMIDHYGCRSFEDVMHRFGLSTAAANIAWQNYRRWKRHAPCAEDMALLNWILYLRRPVEITESNMYQVNPFDSVLETGCLASTTDAKSDPLVSPAVSESDLPVSPAVSESNCPINPGSPKSTGPITSDASGRSSCQEKKEPPRAHKASKDHNSQNPPPSLVNASPLPKKAPKRSEKMRRYHKKKRMQIEKELAQVREDMDSLHRMDADFLGAAENSWLYSDY